MIGYVGVKIAIQLASAIGTGTIVRNIVQATTPIGGGLVNRLMVSFGSFALGGIAGEASSKYMGEMLDAVFVKKPKKTEDGVGDLTCCYCHKQIVVALGDSLTGHRIMGNGSILTFDMHVECAKQRGMDVCSECQMVVKEENIIKEDITDESTHTCKTCFKAREEVLNRR